MKYTKILNTGFTLIELLVVISIIGILIGLSIFGLQGARETSRDAKRKSDLELVRSGVEIYKSDCNTYPISSQLTPGSSLVGAGAVPGCVGNIYISQIPNDPTSPNSTYSYSSDGVTYAICAALEQAPSPAPDPNGPIQNCGSCGSTSCNYVVTNP